MKIDYLVSTMVFWWREHHLSFEMECDFLKSLGYGIEIWPSIRGHNDCRFEKRNWSRLKDATNDMKVALHGRVDGPTLKEWKEQILCAKYLSAKMTTHPESLCISDTLDIADWDFAKDVVKIAQENDVPLAVEMGTLPAMLEIGEKLDYITYCFNTGHANIDEENSFKDYVDKLGDRVDFVHLTDNYGNIDDHQPPGIGSGIKKQDWQYLLDTLAKNGKDITAAFEMYPSMPGLLIKRAQDFMFNEMNWPNQPQKETGHEERHYRPM